MRRAFVGLALGVMSVSAAIAQAPGAKKLERYDEIGPALIACWKPPPGSAGMEITIIFSMKRSGEIFGKPRISHSAVFGDESLQRSFVASALAALATCAPLPLSDRLGGAVAGRPFAMLFRASAPQRGI